MLRSLVNLLAAGLCFCTLGYAQSRACPIADEKQALIEADALRTWDALYKSYNRYQKCDDGAIAEGYSESVARILVDRWNTLPRLAELAKADPGFLHFVSGHIDATSDEHDLRKIKARSKTACPKELRTVCNQLAKATDYAMKETVTSAGH